MLHSPFKMCEFTIQQLHYKHPLAVAVKDGHKICRNCGRMDEELHDGCTVRVELTPVRYLMFVMNIKANAAEDCGIRDFYLPEDAEFIESVPDWILKKVADEIAKWFLAVKPKNLHLISYILNSSTCPFCYFADIKDYLDPGKMDLYCDGCAYAANHGEGCAG